MKTLSHTLLLACTGLFAAAPAQATWMGLPDGSYDVVLHCTQSTEIPCPSDTTGTMVLQGSSVSAFDFTIDGVHYVGNPVDAVVDGNLVDTESSTLSMPGPFQFLSLRLITDGQIGSFGTGDNWWVYCSNFQGGNTCTPNTTGLWSATPQAPVPEPPLPALLVPAVMAWLWTRRRPGPR